MSKVRKLIAILLLVLIAEVADSAAIAQENPGIKITQPANNEQFYPGDTVTVLVEPKGAANITSVFLISKFFSGSKKSSPFTFQFELPQGASGTYNIMAMGDDSSGTPYKAGPVAFQVRSKN